MESEHDREHAGDAELEPSLPAPENTISTQAQSVAGALKDFSRERNELGAALDLGSNPGDSGQGGSFSDRDRLLGMRLLMLQAQNHLSDSVLSGFAEILDEYCEGDVDVEKGMKYVQTLSLQYVQTPICWKGCVAFAGATAEELHCPKCDTPRYGEDGAQCIARTLPIRKYIERMAGVIDICGELLAYQRAHRPRRAQSDLAAVSDWMDGEKAREMDRAGFDWSSDLAFTVCFDGFTDSMARGTAYDAVVLRNMSLPPGLRSKKEMSIVYSVLPRGLKTYDAVFQLFVDEMRRLWTNPVAVTNQASAGEAVVHRAAVVCVVADLKGIPHASGCSTYPATRGACHICHVKGVHFGTLFRPPRWPSRIPTPPPEPRSSLLRKRTKSATHVGTDAVR